MTALRRVAERPLVAAEAETLMFGGLTILFDDRVLQPRPWTTMQSDWAAELLATAPPGPVLELCAGVGHIGQLTVALQRRSLLQVDLNDTACEFARRNAEAAQLSSLVEVRHGRMEDVLEDYERFALIIADPPWVPSDQTQGFPDDPITAIDGGVDGLDVARTCLAVIGRHLDDTGCALLQLGSSSQVESVHGHLLEHPELGLQVEDSRSHADGNVVVRLVRPGSVQT